MRSSLNKLWLIGAVALLLVATGCSGINASHSVSPATFILPGLMNVTPPQADPLAPEVLPSSATISKAN